MQFIVEERGWERPEDRNEELEDLMGSLQPYPSLEAAMRLRALTELSEMLNTDALVALVACVASSRTASGAAA